MKDSPDSACYGHIGTDSITVFVNHLTKIIEKSSSVIPEDIHFGIVLDQHYRYRIGLRNGNCSLDPNAHKSNDCEFHCSSDVLEEICTGTLNPIRAFLDGRLLIYGDVGLALSLREHFALRSDSKSK